MGYGGFLSHGKYPKSPWVSVLSPCQMTWMILNDSWGTPMISETSIYHHIIHIYNIYIYVIIYGAALATTPPPPPMGMGLQYPLVLLVPPPCGLWWSPPCGLCWWYVSIFLSIYLSFYVCTYVCMYVSKYVCMYGMYLCNVM